MKTTNLYSFKFHLLLSLLLLGCFGMAQQTITKSHYRIINDGFEASLKYEKALEHTFLDDLRYLDTRRQIQIEGTQISIELFSAQELLANYGKPISPLTDRKSAVITPIKFKLAKNNYSLLTTGVVDNEQQTTANIKLAQKETITTFGSTLGDKGGLNANYSNNEIYTKTIYSDNGESPYLNFTLFDVENHFDVMYIYDGPSATSKLIGAYSGSIKPKTVKASGAYLTVIFVSDGSNTRQGWSAVVGRGIPQNPPSTMGATDSCGSAAPFCSGSTTTFPASTDGNNSPGSGPSAQTGPSYGCLSSTPNPAWYYLKISTSGTLVLNIAGSAGNDVDFICWGPFTSSTAPCASGLTGGCGFGVPTNTTNSPCSGNIVDCSYSTSATETCTINNAVAGQYYMLLITNYEDMPQNIDLSQTGGNGATDCSIVTCGVTASNTGPYCVGQTINLSAATTNTTATTYSWAGPGGFTSTLQNPTISNASLAMSGTYSVTGTTGGTVTCTEVTSVTVTASAAINVTPTSICAGGTGTLTASGAASYTWNTGATTATITDSPASTTVYTVTGGTGTCTSTATSTITVVSNPSINVNSATICTGNSAVLTANGVTTYNWSPPTGLSTTTSSVVTANPLSTTVYTITGSIGTCSASPVTTTVTVISAIVPTVTSNTPCANQTLSLTCNPGSYTNYAWAGPGAFSSSLQNPTKTGVTIAAAGIYTLVVTDASNCVNTGTVNVTINPLPVVTASASPACLNTPLNLYASGGVSYSWSGQSGAYTSSQQNPVIPSATMGAAGIYVVTVTDGNGCINANSTVVTVYPLPNVGVNDTTVCLLTTGTLTATGAQNYSWSPGTDLNTNVGNPVLVTPSTLATTVYTVTGQDIHGCTNTATAIVMVSALPTVSVSPSITKGCTPQCPTFSVTGDSLSGYNWNFGNGVTSTTSKPSVCFTSASNFVVKLTATDINGCKNVATASVVTYPIPAPDFNYSPKPVTILEPKVTFINETYGANVVGYAWNFGDEVIGDSSNLKDPVHTYANVGTYPVTLIATSSNGCKDTIVKDVIIEQDFVLYVPNAFSPNGDGRNEIFKPEGEGIVDFKMYIFDRWGNRVFTTDNIDVGWNGRHNNKNGEALQEDIYVWKIDLRNANHQGKTYSGTVTLLK